MTLHNAFGDEIRTYCLLDRDYHSDEEVAARQKEATARGVELHVWHRKEIENYLLDPIVIHRLLGKRLSGSALPSVSEVEERILSACDDELEVVIYGTAEVLLTKNRGLGIGAHKMAKEQVEAVWGDPARRVAMAPGKAVLGRLSHWCQKNYGASFGAPAVARNFHTHEISSEVRLVLEAMENATEFGE
jgi:hypothetical protein